MSRFVIGVDVGGTNIKLGLVKSSGIISARSFLKTELYISHPKVLMRALVIQIRELMTIGRIKRSQVAGIGIGLPGLIDPPAGIVEFLPNIPGWRKIPLRRYLQTHLKIPIFLENDVNLITLGEWRFGAGRGFKNMVCLTLGTGVGSGLILDNALYRGEGFVAGELGHMPLNETGPRCNCGGVACFERYVGSHSLAAEAARRFRRTIRLEDVTILARQGQVKAIRFWEDAGARIGRGLVGTVNLLNPTLIIIGGGVSNAPSFVLKIIERTIKARAMKVQASMVKVVRAALGTDAGIIGARVLVAGH